MSSTSTSPFELANTQHYENWREHKLKNYPASSEEIMTPLDTLANPSPEQLDRLVECCAKTNMALYTAPDCAGLSEPDETAQACQLAEHAGLYRLEAHRSGEDGHGLVRIEVSDKGGKAGFIPYTTKRLNWHTDGYYNEAAQRIKSFFMHCVRPAAQGGENIFLDHELAYIRLRDENPDFIKALFHRRAMTIPAFMDTDGTGRPDCSGAVLSIDRYIGSLHMRFTARKHNVVWKKNKITQEAVAFLMDVLENDPLRFSIRLEAGQGVISNNVLHCRSDFEDIEAENEKRLMLRGRYLDRVAENCPKANELSNRQYNAGVWK